MRGKIIKEMGAMANFFIENDVSAVTRIKEYMIEAKQKELLLFPHLQESEVWTDEIQKKHLEIAKIQLKKIVLTHAKNAYLSANKIYKKGNKQPINKKLTLAEKLILQRKEREESL